MIEINPLLIAFGIGLSVSVVFFLGLALGIRKALSSASPVLWLFGSFVLRSVWVVLAAYWLIQWLHPLSALVGFTLAFMLVRLLSVRVGGKHGFNT